MSYIMFRIVVYSLQEGGERREEWRSREKENNDLLYTLISQFLTPASLLQ